MKGSAPASCFLGSLHPRGCCCSTSCLQFLTSIMQHIKITRFPRCGSELELQVASPTRSRGCTGLQASLPPFLVKKQLARDACSETGSHRRAEPPLSRAVPSTDCRSPSLRNHNCSFSSLPSTGQSQLPHKARPVLARSLESAFIGLLPSVNTPS